MLPFVNYVVGIIVGIIIGCIFMSRKNQLTKISGIIKIEKKNNLVRVLVTSSELSNPKILRASFKVSHGIDLSRKKQRL